MAPKISLQSTYTRCALFFLSGVSRQHLSGVREGKLELLGDAPPRPCDGSSLSRYLVCDSAFNQAVFLTDFLFLSADCICSQSLWPVLFGFKHFGPRPFASVARLTLISRYGRRQIASALPYSEKSRHVLTPTREGGTSALAVWRHLRPPPHFRSLGAVTRTTSPVMPRSAPRSAPPRLPARCTTGVVVHPLLSLPAGPRSGSDSAAAGWRAAGGTCWLPGAGAHGGCGAGKRLRGFGGRRHVRLPGGGQAGERCPGRGRGLRPAGGALDPPGARGGAAAGPPRGPRLCPQLGSARGWPRAEGELAVLVTAARRLGWLLPLVPRGGCVVEAGCREAVAVPSVNGEVWAARRRAASLKEAF